MFPVLPRLSAAFVCVLAMCLVHTDLCAQSGSKRSHDSGRDPGPLTLPQPTRTVKIRPELMGVHPRIYLTAADLPAFREKLKEPSVAVMWASFLSLENAVAAEEPPRNPPNTEDPFRSFGERLPNLAFAYLVTRDPKYLAGARNWINAVERYPSWAGDRDLAAGHISYGLALAYDWLYHDLDADERKRIENTLERHVHILLERSMTPGRWGRSYYQNHFWINHTGVAVAAMALYETDPREKQAWLDYTRSLFDVTYHHFGPDGANYEGSAYVGYGTMWMLYYIDALRSISGESLYDMPYLHGVTRFLMDTMVNNWKTRINFGDCNPIGGVTEEPILPRLASEYRDGHAEWLRRANRAALGSYPPAGEYHSALAILWYDPTVRPEPPTDLPTTGVYADYGYVVFRTGWYPDAAVVALHCGPPGGLAAMRDWLKLRQPAADFGHSHPDTNSFIFYSDHQWRIGNPGQYTHDKETHNENTWVVGGEGQRGRAEWFDGTSYTGLGPAQQPHLVRVASSPEADYVIGEAGPAYPAESGVSSYARHLLFVKAEHPYVVVYDRLESKQPQIWTSFLHTYGSLSVDGQNFSAQGANPEHPPFSRLPSDDFTGLTASFGSVVGPAPVSLSAGPLMVKRHPDSKIAQRGFELTAATPQTRSTWLITVVGDVARPMKLIDSDADAPAVALGSDEIRWRKDGGVSLNQREITGNLLPPR